MVERIVKNKRICNCLYCRKRIDTDYKVKYKVSERSKTSKYYHLTCFYGWVVRQINGHKRLIKELNKSKRKFKKYEKHMVLEKL